MKEELREGVIPVLVKVYPEMKQVVPDACKGRVPYFVFMAKEAVEALNAYLADREDRVGPLEDGQVLFCSGYNTIPKERRPYVPLNMTAPEKFLRKAGGCRPRNGGRPPRGSLGP
ncbi:MAG: hypothetical protein QW587_00465 [Candidatus Bathyarchaeia archaeon]